MDYSDMVACSSAGVREIMELLSSCPPELTATELKEQVINGILFADYFSQRTDSGKCHTHWRKRICAVLTGTPDLPEELIRKGVERIFDKLHETSMVEWTVNLWSIPNLPEDLRERLLKLNHQHFSAPRAIKRALNGMLPVWLAVSGATVGFVHENGVYLFRDRANWTIVDRSEKGVLIQSRLYFENRETRVVLLPDVTSSGPGCAVGVDPRVETVHGAIAWMYQQNPQKWQGFDREV
jgi:hypothetical protein